MNNKYSVQSDSEEELVSSRDMSQSHLEAIRNISSIGTRLMSQTSLDTSHLVSFKRLISDMDTS